MGKYNLSIAINGENTLVVMDTNAWLNLYNLPIISLKEIVDVLEEYKDIFWIPNQVHKEYYRHAKEKKDTRVSVFKNARAESLQNVETSKQRVTQILKTFLNQSYISSQELKDKLDEKYGEIIDLIKEEYKKYEAEFAEERKIIEDENIVDKLFDLVYEESKQEDFSIVEKMHICEEGEIRYKYQIAPGYTDAEKENDKNDFTRKYGDLIIWKEILKRVSGTCINVIFVQDEKKQDWLAQKGGNVLAPVLLEEYQSATNNSGKIEVCDFIGFLENYGESMGLPVSKVEELTELLRFERRVYQYIIENMHEISQNKIEEFFDDRYSFYEVANQITWNSVYGGSFEDADEFEIDNIEILAPTIYYEKNIKICTINSKFVVHGRAEIKEYISREVSYSGNVELDLSGEMYMDIIIDYSDTTADSDSAYEVANVDIRVSDVTWDNASEYSMDVKYD